MLVSLTRTPKYYSEKSFSGASVIAVDELLLAPLDRTDTAQASCSVWRPPRKSTFTSDNTWMDNVLSTKSFQDATL